MEKFCPSTCFCALSMASRDHLMLDGYAFFEPAHLCS